MKVTAVCACLLFPLALPAVASARERLAVIIASDTDPVLADNLTEVAIARLAETRRFELVGQRELDGRLREIATVRDRGLAACLGAPGCLSQLGSRAQAGLALVGIVRPDGEGFELEMRLVEPTTAEIRAESAPTYSADLRELIVAVKARAGELVEREAADSAPAAAPATYRPKIELQPAPAAEPRWTPVAHDVPRHAPRAPARMPTSTYVALGAGAAAVLAFSAAVITGALASAPPSGETRMARQADVERRRDYATAANVSWIAGGVFTAGAGVAFTWR